MQKKLRKGYTTGVHALFAFCSALSIFVRVGGVVVSFNRKMENDDLDVTKNVKIILTLSEKKENIPLNPIPHTPFSFGKAELFAGIGVGVVTKDGLKVPKGFPAINPVPLKEIKRCYEILGENRRVFISISVENGEEIAKKTANQKVGVIGGISILGTSGFVNPVSNEAFLESIKTEIKVAKLQGFERVVFTLGKSSFELAKTSFKETQIIEIGNFIYDSLTLAKKFKIKKITLIVGIAKALKVAQGFKNTHNRFGSIDFELLQKEIQKEFKVLVDINSTKTLKGILEQLRVFELEEEVKSMIRKNAQKRLKSWFKELEIELITL